MSDVPRRLPSWVSTIQSVVLTADVLLFFRSVKLFMKYRNGVYKRDKLVWIGSAGKTTRNATSRIWRVCRQHTLLECTHSRKKPDNNYVCRTTQFKTACCLNRTYQATFEKEGFVDSSLVLPNDYCCTHTTITRYPEDTLRPDLHTIKSARRTSTGGRIWIATYINGA